MQATGSYPVGHGPPEQRPPSDETLSRRELVGTLRAGYPCRYATITTDTDVLAHVRIYSQIGQIGYDLRMPVRMGDAAGLPPKKAEESAEFDVLDRTDELQATGDFECEDEPESDPFVGLVVPGRSLDAGDLVGGKYKLLRRLSEGGMGSLWVAHDQTLDIRVALKLIRSELRSVKAKLGERLLQEARAAARLRHPAIVNVTDFGRTALGDPFLVMELLKGEDLAAMLGRRGHMKADKAVQLLLPIAHALSTAHDVGIVHRDLKPDNIFLIKKRGSCQPKLIDFGVAKLEDLQSGRLTDVGSMVGSPRYMSPEQTQGADVDYRADIWGFCVVLYELLIGELPFVGTTYASLIMSIQGEGPIPFSDFDLHDEELWAIVERGLRKDPDERWGSMFELGSALAKWLLARDVYDDICGTGLEVHWLRQGAARSEEGVSDAPPESVGPHGGESRKLTPEGLLAASERSRRLTNTLVIPPSSNSSVPPRNIKGDADALISDSSDEPELHAIEDEQSQAEERTALSRQDDADEALHDEAPHGEAPAPSDSDDEAPCLGTDDSLIPNSSSEAPAAQPVTSRRSRKRTARSRVFTVVAVLAAGLGGLWVGLKKAPAPAASAPTATALSAAQPPVEPTSPLQPSAAPSAAASALAAAPSASAVGPAKVLVQIESTPGGAAIFVDGADTGKRTPAKLSLVPGSAIELRRRGFAPAKRKLEAGQKRVQQRLRRYPKRSRPTAPTTKPTAPPTIVDDIGF